MCFAMHAGSAATHSQKAEFEGGENETGKNECKGWKKKRDVWNVFFLLLNYTGSAVKFHFYSK